MRYRQLDSNDDYMFGRGSSEIMKNTPEAVGQAVKTRLLLGKGEWFIDTDAGTPYIPDILGHQSQPIFDQVIQQQIIGTTGVSAITDYSSVWNTETRSLSITATIETIYGSTTFTQEL